MKRYITLLMLVTLVLLQISVIAGGAEEKFILIANQSVEQTSIKISEIQRVFLGKSSSFANGQKIVPVTLESGEVHEAFLKKCVKKSSSQYSTFWKQAIFTGQGIPPKSFASEDELLNYVAQTPGAIGYVSAKTSPSNVKVLEVE